MGKGKSTPFGSTDLAKALYIPAIDQAKMVTSWIPPTTATEISVTGFSGGLTMVDDAKAASSQDGVDYIRKLIRNIDNAIINEGVEDDEHHTYYIGKMPF